MIFPLRRRHLVRGCAEHQAAGLGCGADYTADYEDLLAPVPGVIERLYEGTQGGRWLWLKDPWGASLQFAHLDAYVVSEGDRVTEGQVIARTGNTGTVTTGPHLHVQIVHGNSRLDPEAYFLNAPLMGNFDNHVIRNKVTGAFAYVKDGKKQQFDNSNGAVAIMTFLDRLGSNVFPQAFVKGVSALEWDSLPNVSNLFPPMR